MNIDQIIALQRAHASAQARTSLSYRLQKLDELRRALQGPWQEKLANALHEDFGKSPVEVGLTDPHPIPNLNPKAVPWLSHHGIILSSYLCIPCVHRLRQEIP